jgi:hypothetical protein
MTREEFEAAINAVKSSAKAYSDKLKTAYSSPDAFKQAFMSNLAELAPPDPRDKDATMQFAINRAMDIPGGFAGAIKTWHGSPHKFDAFDMSKIGTGEGAQAYGHGLYFAENPATAQSYADDLGKSFSVNGKKIYDSNEILGDVGNQDLQDALVANLGDTKKAASFLLESAREMRNANASPKPYQEALAELRAIRSGVDVADKGNLYQTSLEWPDAAREAADPLGPQHFLDWDKPLADQNQKIKQALAKYDPDTYHPDGYDYDEMESGADIYTRLKSSGLDGKLSDLLGIPGIRYLDQGSRGAGEGSYNYVVFDDKIPKIIERNGKPMGLLGEPK